MNDHPSKILVEQRIRNRIFEYLEGVIEYEREPGVWDLNELVNEWEFNINAPFSANNFPPPVFTENERAALAKVNAAWLAFTNVTPRKIFDEKQALFLPEWLALLTACSVATKVFSERGRFSEEYEIE